MWTFLHESYQSPNQNKGAHPVILAQISLEDSKYAVSGVAIADDQMCEDKFVFWSRRHHRIATEFQTCDLPLVHVTLTPRR